MMTGLPGPCVICGDTNYNLSCGGPTICPKCDCGHFDAATVVKQAKVIADLRSDLSDTEAQLDAFGKVTPQQYQKEAASLKARIQELEGALQKIVEANQIQTFRTIETDPAGNTMAVLIVDGACAAIARAALEAKPAGEMGA